MDNNYYHDHSNQPISEELSNEDKDFIKSMYGWKESVQIPMLADKIILLSKRISDLDKSTTTYSKVIVILTVVLIVLGFFQLMATVLAGLISGWWAFAYTLLFLAVAGFSMRYVGGKSKK